MRRDLFPLLRPFVARLDPEMVHRLTVWALKRDLGPELVPREGPREDPRLAVEALGLRFSNPLGLAAGFDKNAEVIAPALALGFGFVEVGSVTPRPQAGNPRPRLFRLPEDRAVINRMGFNSQGMAAVQARLAAWRAAGGSRPPVGVNLGKNRDTREAAADYAAGAATLGPYADYLVINLSSPNTPGLRSLQSRRELEHLIGKLRAALLPPAPPLLLKVAPDLEPEERKEIAGAALELALDGMIVANTTLARPETLKSARRSEAGGLSGRPLYEPSTAQLAEFRRLTEGRLTLVGTGGVESGAHAYGKLRAGASLVQLYTALVYEGPGLVARIKRELLACLERDGLPNVSAAVGLDAN